MKKIYDKIIENQRLINIKLIIATYELKRYDRRSDYDQDQIKIRTMNNILELIQEGGDEECI
mgnify:CR=1 FL=1